MIQGIGRDVSLNELQVVAIYKEMKALPSLRMLQYLSISTTTIACAEDDPFRLRHWVHA